MFFKCLFVVLPLLMSSIKVNSQLQLTRVVGGTPTTIDRYPILAQLLLDTFANQQEFIQHCAGVIITSRHVISAAHCFQYNRANGRDYTQPKFWKIRVGSTLRSRGGSMHGIKEIISHQNFDKYYYKNDIAVVIVNRPFNFGSSVRQATIPKSSSDIKPNSLCSLVGWGSIETDAAQPEELHQTSLYIIEQKTCIERYNTIGAEITDAMMCAGLLDVGGADGCYGDSGGPLVYKGVVVGLVSFGYACGHRYYPGVYTKLSHYTDWILNIVYNNK